jgi:hypothetical protein
MLAGRIRRGALVALLALLAPAAAAIPSSASAQPAAGSEEKQAAAREKGKEGLSLYGAGKWQEAYEKLAEADKLYHAPTLVLYMARCQRQLGKLLAALDLYERVLDEVIPASAPQAFLDAKEIARTERKALMKLVPQLKITVAGVNAEAARVTLDGKPVATLNKEQLVNPGIHVVEAEAPGVAPTGETISLAEGGYGEVKLVLEPRSEGEGEGEGASGGGSAGPRPAISGGAGASEGSLLPAGIAFAVGAIGLGLGAAAGAIALNNAADIKSRCVGNQCLASDKDEAATVEALGNLSTAGFAVCGAGIVAGVVLLLVRPGGGPSRPRARAAEASAFGGVSGVSGVTWSAGPGLVRVDVAGRF